MRPLVFASVASVVVSFSMLALANGTHHSGGGGDGDSEGPCIRWEKISAGAPGTASDAGADVDASDAGGDASAGDDAGSPSSSSSSDSHIGEQCVEHAGVFSCAASAPRSTGSDGALLLFGVIAVIGAAARRRSHARAPVNERHG